MAIAALAFFGFYTYRLNRACANLDAHASQRLALAGRVELIFTPWSSTVNG
jgi:hypothetical protein